MLPLGAAAQQMGLPAFEPGTLTPPMQGIAPVTPAYSSGSTPMAAALPQATAAGSATVTADFGSRLNPAHPVAPNMLGAGLGGVLEPGLPTTVAQAGLMYTRFHAYLQNIFANSTPDFSTLDSDLSAFQAAGMKVILEVDYTPASLQPNPNPCPSGVNAYHAAPSNPGAFASLAASLVTHIDQNFPGVVSDYEIWNEPDGGGLCSGDNSNAAKLKAYLGLYAAVAPALRAAATQDGVQIHIGGPTLGSPLASAPTWIPALLTNPGTAPYVDFVSMHYYQSNPTDATDGLSWSGSGGPSLLTETQDPNTGMAAVYEMVAGLVHQSQSANAPPIPVYLDEYNEDWGFVNDCCRNDATYAPLWNSLVMVDLLNSVYSGAPAAPARVLYYAISNPPFCLIGQWDPAMDCNYPANSPASAQPYPQYYALQLFASPTFLGLNSGAFLANSAASTSADLQVAAFYTVTTDMIVIVNTSANDYNSVTVQASNPGLPAAQAAVYLLNSSNPQISTESTPLRAAGAGLQATVTVPHYSVVALSLQVTPAAPSGITVLLPNGQANPTRIPSGDGMRLQTFQPRL